ncbi:MAG: hypothetical protein M5U20_01390 [Phycisphaerales bacterium]|nr:hypothetical protein [Phycisphaerales bacterium]
MNEAVPDDPRRDRAAFTTRDPGRRAAASACSDGTASTSSPVHPIASNAYVTA